MKKIIIPYLALLLLLPFVNAEQSCQTYDDFSAGLNLNKWEEIGGSDVNSLFVDEHYVSGEDNMPYHTSQNSSADRGVTLRVKNKTFVPEDIIEYDINYISGSDNRISVVELDGNYKWLGLIGFWNGIQVGGNNFGIYHFKTKFDSLGADVNITKPDNSVVTQRLDSATSEHTFGFGTRTGHDGLVHMDYDNVVICSEQNINETPNLEERLNLLEIIVNSLKEMINNLIGIVGNHTLLLEKHEGRIDNLTKKVNNNTNMLLEHENRILGLENITSKFPEGFNYLSLGERKNVLCGFAQKHRLTQITDLGLDCILKYIPTKTGEKVICNCKKLS